jgi:hypothetical protein
VIAKKVPAGWAKACQKPVISKINTILLVSGFIAQSVILFHVADSESRFDIISLGFWAWVSIPFLILFFANRHLKYTKAARITLLIAVIIVAVLGSLLIFDAFFIHLDPQSGIMLILVPLYEIVLSVIALLIAIPLNFIFERSGNPHI